MDQARFQSRLFRWNQHKKFVNRIRRTEIILGSKIKKAQPCELSNIKSIRKSLVARKDIKKNEIITEDNLAAKRPGIGVSPMQIHKLINKFSKKNIKKDEILKWKKSYVQFVWEEILKL